MKSVFKWLLLGAMAGTTALSISSFKSAVKANPVSATSPTQTSIRWPISLTDQTRQSQDFLLFNQKLWRAVHNRDAFFIRSLVNAKTTFEIDGKNGNQFLNTLNLDNPEAPFWSQMQKAITPGCTIEKTSTIQRDSGSSVWLCSPVLRAFEAAGKNAPAGQDWRRYGEYVVIVGTNVNIRSQPNTSGSIVGQVSQEVIRFDRAKFHELSPQVQKGMVPWNLNGWTPVMLLNGRRGYVSNRYAYQPLERRAIFVKEGGKWQLRSFVAGD